MVRKKPYGPKEPGQQYDEIEKAQRRLGRDRIGNIDKSKQRDKEELKRFADEALERLRQRQLRRARRRQDEEE
jgi:hypothetical protein